MPTTVNFRRLFDFSQLPIIITAAVLAALTIGIILMFLYNLLKDVQRKEKPAEEAPKPVFVKPDLAKLKAEYMEKINKIEIKYNEDTTKIRPAYEGMSKVVREFVYKASSRCPRSARPNSRALQSSSANTISRSSTKYLKVTSGRLWREQGDW